MSDLVKVMNRIPLTNLIMDKNVYKYLKEKFQVFDVVGNKKIPKDKHINLWIKSTNMMNGADLVTSDEMEYIKSNN